MAGGDAAADVAFGLVFIQHRLDLEVEGTVEPGQSFAEVFMYRRLGHAEDFGGGADGGAVLNDVTGQSTGPLLDISLQRHALPIPELLFYPMSKKRET